MISDPLIAFWLTFGVSAALAYPIYRALIALKSQQTIDPYAPEGHKKKQGTPTMGGLIVLAGLIPGLIFTQSDHSMIIACMAFALIGFVDDFVVPRLFTGKRGLGWKQKIVLQIGAGIAAAMLSPAFAGDWKRIAVAVFVILFFANAYNFADGLDGLAGGLLAVTAIGMMALGFDFPFWYVLLGAILPFLFLNSPPAKVFMGDVGSLPIGAVLGVHYAWLLTAGGASSLIARWDGIVFLAIANMVLVLELVLVPIQIAVYKLTKKRLFPATPIHHGFEVKGWPETRVVWTFILFQIVCIFGASAWAKYAMPMFEVAR